MAKLFEVKMNKEKNKIYDVSKILNQTNIVIL